MKPFKIEKNETLTVFCFSSQVINQEVYSENGIWYVGKNLSQGNWEKLISDVTSEYVMLIDTDIVSLEKIGNIRDFFPMDARQDYVYYLNSRRSKLWFGCIKSECFFADREILTSPIFIGAKEILRKAYVGNDLASDPMVSVAYSLQKQYVRFCVLDLFLKLRKKEHSKHVIFSLFLNNGVKIPFVYLLSGSFFRELFCPEKGIYREIVYRMLMLFFILFCYVYMPVISKDYGVTGDEFVDHRHANYVLDYYIKGDKRALDQPQTALHLYGNVVQVITAAVCRCFNVENYYELRHCVGGVLGATGIWAVGLIGLRWGGGLCGLISLLLMFFTPRFFGHSMNNLKDVPFAVGYVLALFYTIRLFDTYPFFRWRYIVGLILGITLALGTRSGGLVLYPMIFMYAGLYYVLYYGIRNFYKFKRYARIVGQILLVLFIVFAGSYVLSILLWPFALQNPLSGVLDSLAKFTNYSVGLRTIFDGEQMMSNMLPWRYAPKYLCIGMPIVTLIGFLAYVLYMVVRKKEFSLISFFLLFAVIFPVYWVIYSHSNLYGGIRHMLFVMPPMVVVAGRFWSEIMNRCRGYLKLFLCVVFIGLLSLPVLHVFRNHPNEYVYFNEFIGGLEGAYGAYETDYYFNSLKSSADWFKENVLPDLSENEKITIVTQASDIVHYYFRHDTNINVVYSRYYEKYAKNWDYAIWGNVYISSHQLKSQLFPPVGLLYSPTVDTYPMSCVLKRNTKMELQGFQFEKERKYGDAIRIFREYCEKYPQNEEIWARLGKLYYLTGQLQEAQEAFENALNLYPDLNEALYILTLMNIELKDFSAAWKNVNKMLAVNASAVDAWYLKALIFYKQKQYKNAIEALNYLLSYRIDFDRAHVLAGDIFRDIGNFAQAAQMYEQARKYKNNLSNMVQLADMFVRLKEYSKAEQLLEKALKLQSTYYPIYKVMVRMFMQQNQLQEAGKVLMRLENISNDAELWVLRARYSELTNDRKMMRNMLDQALKVDSENVEALKMRKTFKL